MQKITFADEIIGGLPFPIAGPNHEFADATTDNIRVVVAGDRKAFFYVPDFTPDKGVRWRLGWFPELGAEAARGIAAAARTGRRRDISMESPRPPRRSSTSARPIWPTFRPGPATAASTTTSSSFGDMSWTPTSIPGRTSRWTR
ncbi:hypothetical protein [Rhizobium sp. BK060]|uniref:hypothetical protein n=1 Tax=Rhizobium sp. BK060 TaxID=2587096 RepID=UPI00161A5A32|nr:hypothetical protein [Rhizobium sp. BK060]MBB3398832.1 hypothetical protein [Rhizobium sp. BK060]